MLLFNGSLFFHAKTLTKKHTSYKTKLAGNGMGDEQE